MNLGVTISQSMQLSPQMVQNLKVLQMNSQQLLEYIEELTAENPVVEADERFDRVSRLEQFRLKLNWLKESDVQNRVYYSSDGEERDPFATVCAQSGTLEDYIVEQLGERTIDTELMNICRYIAQGLDDNGYFTDTAEDIASSTLCSVAVAAEALRTVRALEPVGVAAASLAECLACQIRAKLGEGSLAEKIALEALPSLGMSRYGYIAKQLGATEAEVREAAQVIKSLNPRVSAGFAGKERPVYITPDVIVVNFPDHFELLTNDYYFPTIRISSYYNKLCGESDDKSVRDYLTDKLRQAKWAVKAISQRRDTILRCAETIVKRQEDFFRFGSGHLSPMTLADVADDMEVHESTVSRAIRDKYIQCAWGVFPLSELFSRGLSGTSADRIKLELSRLVEGENAKKPLSDEAICQRLSQMGYEVSRRTVAKYRVELGIGSSVARRTK